MSWYLRTSKDADTHCGELLGNGYVVARCGLEFRPRPLLLGEGRIALPGHPQDRDQICPDCSRAKAAP